MKNCSLQSCRNLVSTYDIDVKPVVNILTEQDTTFDDVDLNNVENKIDPHNNKSRHAQMAEVTDICLQRLDEKSLKYHIGGREFSLEDQIAKTVQLVQSMKAFIGEAVRVSPEASLAWTGVCIVLPIFTNPSEAKQANQEGFTYVTSRLKFYIGLEELLWPQNSKDNAKGLGQVRTELEANIVGLYRQILNFQIRTVLRCYGRRGMIFLRDLVQWDGWNGMLDDIKKREESIHKDSNQLNSNTSRQMLESMEGSTKKYVSLMENLGSISEQQLEINKQQLALHERREKRDESEQESKCHQLFRLARDDRDNSYEWYKKLVEPPIDGTCRWFLSREEFQAWEMQETGLLIVSADPGCGKSVLAKHLIDNRLPQSSTVCYFFFKEQLQNTERQALCALLHQLFAQKPQLVQHAMPEYRQNGEKLPNVTSALWDILWRATSDPDAGSIAFVLDALDECDTDERIDLIQNLNGTFNINNRFPGSTKFLLTTRPYSQILSQFDGLVDEFPHIHIPGEGQSEMISEEVNRAIGHKVDQLTNLSPKNKEYLKERLLAVENRTYLWVSLVIEFIKTRRIRNTKEGVGKALGNLPMSVYEAYERILSKSDGDDDVLKALNLVLAAVNPLTLSEMNIALSMNKSTKFSEELDLEDEKDFKAALRDMCGLFLSIHDDKVHFIHQTARDFLLKKQPEPLKNGRFYWNGTLSLQRAHLDMAQSCIFYLDSDVALKNREFSQYATRNWIHHLRESQQEPQGEFMSSVLNLCDPYSNVHARWPGLMGDRTPLCNKNALWTAVCLELGNVVKALTKKEGVDLEEKHFGECTPLAYAAQEGYGEIVRILLQSGRVRVNVRAAHKQTPLILSLKREQAGVATQLLKTRGIDLDARDESGRSALSWAAMRGYVAVVQFLLSSENVDPNKPDRTGKTPLFWAVIQEEVLVVKFLLQSSKVDPNVKDRRGRTALSCAYDNGLNTIVELLLKNERTDPDLPMQDN